MKNFSTKNKTKTTYVTFLRERQQKNLQNSKFELIYKIDIMTSRKNQYCNAAIQKKLDVFYTKMLLYSSWVFLREISLVVRASIEHWQNIKSKQNILEFLNVTAFWRFVCEITLSLFVCSFTYNNPIQFSEIRGIFKKKKIT